MERYEVWCLTSACSRSEHETKLQRGGIVGGAGQSIQTWGPAVGTCPAAGGRRFKKHW